MAGSIQEDEQMNFGHVVVCVVVILIGGGIFLDIFFATRIRK